MFTNLPNDIQKEIAAYLDTDSLRFFAQTSRRSLSNVRSHLISRQQRLLRSPNISLLAHGTVSWCYTANAIYACGDNRFGQLGLGHTTDCKTLTPLANLPGRIQQVVAGNYHTLVLTDNGLYACGYNDSGQLGLGHTDDCMTLTPLPPLPGTIQQLVASVDHTVVLTDQGLYGCGANSFGELELGHTDDCMTLTPLAKLPGTILQIGGLHTLVLTDQGLCARGDNKYGQLGLGHTDDCMTLTPLAKLLPGTIQQVMLGDYHTLVLTDQGLYACGKNDKGQLGLGHTDSCTTLTPVKNLPPELQQLLALYRQLGKLIAFSEAKDSPEAEGLNPSNNTFFSPK